MTIDFDPIERAVSSVKNVITEMVLNNKALDEASKSEALDLLLEYCDEKSQELYENDEDNEDAEILTNEEGEGL